MSSVSIFTKEFWQKESSIKIRIVVAVLTLPTIGLLYQASNLIVRHFPTITLQTSLDTIIPFTAIWIIPYYFYYILAPIPPLFMKNNKEILRFILTYSIVMFFSYIFFFLLNVQMIRPELGRSGFFVNMVSKIYGSDFPVNCFPSQHVAYSLTAAIFLNRRFPKLIILWVCMVVMVALSIVFVKQHWVLDILGGLFFGWYSFNISNRIVKKFIS